MVEAREIFVGFSTYYNSLRITLQESIATNTTRILSYMDSLGRMLGYEIFSELPFSSLFQQIGRECPQDMMRRRPDICWGYRHNGKLSYELVLESEQDMNDEKLEGDLKKLMLLPARIRVLYCSHNDPQRLTALISKAAQEKGGFSGELLLIVDPWVTRIGFGTGELEGVLLDPNLNQKGLGKATITKIDDGPSTVRYFKDVKWWEGRELARAMQERP